MAILVLDTSTEKGYAALVCGKDLLWHSLLPFGQQSAQHAVPAIQQGFAHTGLHWNDIEYIAAGAGPGSYTGIRVGAIVVKAISYALKKPLVGFCSLQAYVPSRPGSYAVLLDAKIGGVYLWKNGSDPLLCPCESLEKHLEMVEILISPLPVPLEKKLAPPMFSRQWIVEEGSLSFIELAEITRQKFVQGKYSTSGALDLHYLRDAVIRLIA